MSTQTWLRDVRRMLDDMGVAHRFEFSSKHVKVFLRQGAHTGLIVVSVSPSDHRALKQVKTDVKRALSLASLTQAS